MLKLRRLADWFAVAVLTLCMAVTVQPNVNMLATRDDIGRAITQEEESALIQACGKSRSRSLVPFVTHACRKHTMLLQPILSLTTALHQFRPSISFTLGSMGWTLHHIQMFDQR